MPLHYRDNDTVSGRWTGNTFADLSAAQVDENFWTLDSRITATQAMITASRGIVSITLAANELTFHMTDSSLEGPFPIPVAAFLSRGAFSAPTAYSRNDTFYINGTVYLVIYPHTSASPFDAGANDGLGHNYYSEMVPNPGNALATGGVVGMVYTKSSSIDFAATWRFLHATEVIFTPSTASGLVSTNVADALEELETKIATEVDHAINVTFTPSTAIVSTNVQDAIEEVQGDLASYLPLAGGTMSGAIVLSADPASALQAATKQYVDSLALNLGKRARVRAATTANITISTALNNGDSLDGVTLATNDLVLVKNQTAPAENGVYVVGASPARDAQFDTYDEHPGSLIAVEEGSTLADTLWLCTSNVGGTLNTTAISFASTGLYTAGTGLTLTGTAFSIDGAIVGRLATANTWALAQTFTVAPVFTDAAGSRGALGLGSIATFPETTTAQYLANTSGKALSTDKVWAAAALVTLTDAATVAVDMSSFINANVTLAGNRTLGNPSNTKPGQTGVIEIIQDGTGARTLAYASNWKFASGVAPTLSTAASAIDLLFYEVLSSTFVYATLVKDVR